MKPSNPAEQVCARLAESLKRGTFARLVLSAPVGLGDLPHKVLGRFVMLKGEPHLSLTLRHATKDVIRNLPVNTAANWLQSQLGVAFRSALVCTTQRDWQFISDEAGNARLVDHRPSSKQRPSFEHDRKRAGFLDATAADWLQGLGIFDGDGKLRASMADKHRQIDHYLELFLHLAAECGWSVGDGPGQRSALQFVDMGCGKGYLTFGLWHLVHRVWKRPAKVIGVESRAALVATTNKLAKQIKAEGLEFIEGSIESVKLPPVDGLIALHACNTATDEAIKRGIELGAKLIIVAPCCHKEIRPQLGRPGPLAPVLGHGLMQERLAEWVTDGLRTLFLEWAGYRTKVMEFIGSEHTPKNLMIAAVRQGERFSSLDARNRIEELKGFFGIKQHALDPLLQK